MNFLGEAEEGFLVLGCPDTDKAFAIPVDVMNDIASEMLTTSPMGMRTRNIIMLLLGMRKGVTLSSLTQQREN